MRCKVPFWFVASVALTCMLGCDRGINDTSLHEVTYHKTQRSSSSSKIDLHVVIYPKALNMGFEIVDVPASNKKNGFVSQHFDGSAHNFIINGGYFDRDFQPVGFCKIDGTVINNQASEKLSGYVAIDDNGKLDLLWRDPGPDRTASVLQCGPYLIDPGGKIGIHSSSGKIAARSVIGKTDNESIVIVISSPVELFELARILKKEISNLDRALNLDGGPSTGFIYLNEIEIENPNPVRNFIRQSFVEAAANEGPRSD